MRLGMWRSGSLPAMFELNVTPLCPGGWQPHGRLPPVGMDPGFDYGNTLRRMSILN